MYVLVSVFVCECMSIPTTSWVSFIPIFFPVGNQIVTSLTLNGILINFFRTLVVFCSSSGSSLCRG